MLGALQGQGWIGRVHDTGTCVRARARCHAANGNPTWYIVPGTTFSFGGDVQTNGTTTVNGVLHLPRYARTR